MLDSRTSLSANTRFEYVDANAGHEAYRMAEISLDATRSFDNGLSLTLDVGVGLRHLEDAHPFFDKKREDRTFHVGGRVLHRSIQYEGFAPYIEYYYENTGSNISLYEFGNDRLGFGVTKQF